MHFNALGREFEEDAGLDNLKTFIHQRGGIDSNFWPHTPIWVFEGFLGSD